jgi:OOP family OmpA-OmpF porin
MGATGVPVTGVIHDARLPGAPPARLSATTRILLLTLLLLAGVLDLVLLDALVLPRFLAARARHALAVPALSAAPLSDVSPPAPAAIAVPALAEPDAAPSDVSFPVPTVVAQEVLAPAEPAVAPEIPAPAEPAVAPPEALPALHFARNVAILNKASRATLRDLQARLTARPELRVTLNGHTDDLGPKRLNAALALRRAKAARAWLVAHGIEEARITVQSFGATVPIDGAIVPASRFQNRRVEIEFH